MIRQWIAVFLALTPALIAEKIPGRYIVELSTEPVAERVSRMPGRNRMRSATATAHRTRLRSEQNAMRPRFEQRRARVLGGVDTVANAMFVEIPDDDASQLASLPGVKRVLPVRMFHMTLDRAVMLHKVTEAWNQIGSDSAGAGVKIAIIDSGIDAGHAGFQDSSLTAPDSFPRANTNADLAYTNGKVIVARSYVSLLPRRDPDQSARDRVGHGTALGMVAAGVRNAGPLATITGVAPKAWLGNYKVFGTPGYNDGASDDAILKAIDDAVADGMDVINLSLGSDLAPRLSDDLEVQAIERASQIGVIVVVAAGNNGPGFNTIASPATAPSAITVGATSNDRTFAASVEVPGLSSLVAILGDRPTPSAPITALLSDVATLDDGGLACAALPANSLAGRIALIARGACSFETKVNNAQRAGAVAALIFSTQESPDAISMSLGTATLPAEMVSYSDGIAIKQSLASQPSLAGTLQFMRNAVPQIANRRTDFSAAGPSVDASIKPEIMAVGGDIYVATQTLDGNGDMYDPSGYALVDGTSFSTPLVAGAAALIKSARPGLSVDQYRSLLINSAVAAQTHSGGIAGIQQVGAGLLDVDAALRSTITAYPASLSLGAGSADAQVNRVLTITNLGAVPEAFTIVSTPQTGDATPVAPSSTAELAVGASINLPVSWNAGGQAPGTYQGVLTVTGTSSGTRINVPYWYAVTSDVPAYITILDSTASGRRGRLQREAVLFRISDVSGLNLLSARPQVTAVSGGGTARGVVSYDGDVPGMFGIDVQLGPVAGPNVFRIQAGDVSADFSITAQ